MPHPLCLATPALLVASIACTSAQDPSQATDASQQVESTTDSPPGPLGTPIQIAQYPGAPFEDRSGNLWFSTVLEGLIRYDGKQFVSFTEDDGLGSNAVRDLMQDEDGTLWIATTGGLTRYDGSTFTTLTEYVDTPFVPGFAQHGHHRDVWDVHRDRAGTLLIATTGGVFRHDGTAFVPFPMPDVAGPGEFEFTPQMVYCIYEAPDGALWFGTDGAGAVRYDGTDMTVYTEELHGLASDRVCTILQDRRGDFWFGTSGGGVSRFNGLAFTTHLQSPIFSEHTGWGRYMAISEDRSGHVWFGVSAAGGGVFRWDGEEFRYFSEADGLGTGGVPSICEDKRGNLWFGTTAGVFRLEGERFVNFTKDR